MTNLRTDEMAFSRSLTKIGTDENKAIYSIVLSPLSMSVYACTKTLKLAVTFEPVEMVITFYMCIQCDKICNTVPEVLT